MTPDQAHLLDSLAVTAAVAMVILSTKAALWFDAHPAYCARCECIQAEHKREFGPGGPCCCGTCPRFIEGRRA